MGSGLREQPKGCDPSREFHGWLELRDARRDKTSEEGRSQTLVGSVCQTKEISFPPGDDEESPEIF